MSTKHSIYWQNNPDGTGFHFYKDYVDDDKFVHLRLDNIGDWQVDKTSCTLTIPIEVWEFIRNYQAMKFDLVDLSDDELWELAGRKAEKHNSSNSSLWSYKINQEDAFEDLKRQQSIQARVKQKLDFLVSERESYHQEQDQFLKDMLGEQTYERIKEEEADN